MSCSHRSITPFRQEEKLLHLYKHYKKRYNIVSLYVHFHKKNHTKQKFTLSRTPIRVSLTLIKLFTKNNKQTLNWMFK